MFPTRTWYAWFQTRWALIRLVGERGRVAPVAVSDRESLALPRNDAGQVVGPPDYMA